jgi:hypothetical protein
VKRTSLLVAGLMLSLIGASSAQAQQVAPARRQPQGLFFNLGMGAGSSGLTCDGCDFDRETGVSGNLRLGMAVRPNMVVSLETNGWYKSEDGAKATLGFLGASAALYPMKAPLFVKAGLGLGTLKVDDGTDVLKSNGLGTTLGVGYDIRLGGGNLALTPFLNYFRSFGAGAKLNGDDVGADLNMNVFQGGVGLTVY